MSRKGNKYSEENFDIETLKKMYLLIFNLYQTIGFAYVILNIASLYLKLGYPSLAIVYDQVGYLVKFLHILQILETIHPMIGFTKGMPGVAFFQLLGRLFIIFMMVDPEPRMHKSPLIPYLFTVWGTIEIIRHLYYVTQLLNKEYPLLTWLRYSAWMVLYPMGIIGEACSMIANIPYLQETLRFSIILPNQWNISFDAVNVLKLQTFFLVCPIMYFLTSHMYKMRVKKMANFKFDFLNMNCVLESLFRKRVLS